MIYVCFKPFHRHVWSRQRASQAMENPHSPSCGLARQNIATGMWALKDAIATEVHREYWLVKLIFLMTQALKMIVECVKT